MIFVNTDLETALRRNKERERTLPDELIHKNYKVIEHNIGRFQRLFGDIHIINNSDDEVHALIIYGSADGTRTFSEPGETVEIGSVNDTFSYMK